MAPAPCAKPPALAARVRTHPDAQAWIDLGNFYGDQKQFVCAQQAFRSGLRLDPSSAQLNYLLGLSLYGSGDLEHAIPPLQRSIQTNNGILKPHLLLASIDATLGQPGEAETEWRAALAIDSSSDMAVHGLAESLLAQKNYPAVIGFLRSVKLDVPLAVDLAVAYNADGMSDDAIATVTDALKTWPTSVRLSAALVTLDVKEKRYDAAERTAAACYQSHPDDVDAQISYMKTLVLNGDWVPARPVGKQMLTAAPHRFETLYFNGVLERQASDFAAARDHLTEAEGLDPNLANLHYNLGVALSRLNDPVRAIEELRKALALGDTQPETHFELAKVLRTQGESEDAGKEMVLYRNLIQHEAQVSIAGSKTAEADQAVEKGDLQLAIQRYREAVAATPDNALISWKLSLALDKANDPDGEHQALEQVIAIDPNFALAQNQLGFLDSRKGDLAGAEQHFHQALQAAPGFTQAWISLAATLGMESKFPEARDALASALRLDPQNTQARELSQELTVAQNQPHH